MSVIHIIKLRLKTRHVSVTAIRPSSGVNSACAFTTTKCVQYLIHVCGWVLPVIYKYTQPHTCMRYCTHLVVTNAQAL
jgi:hypothetical protein